MRKRAGARAVTLRWFLLLTASVLLALSLRWAHLPAAWLFGPLVVAALFAIRGWQTVKISRPFYIAAQSVIGAALGAGFSPGTLRELPQHFVLFFVAVGFILLTSLLNGWILVRQTRLPVATAFLGTMPGGAGEMAAMSDNFHADVRVVVVMQYTRLLIVLGSLALAAPWLAHFFHPIQVGSVETSFPLATPQHWWSLGVLVLLALAGWFTGMWTRIPAGTFLVPAILYLVLSENGFSPGQWPWPVLAAAYLIMGLRIGGQFQPSTLPVIKEIMLPLCGTTLLLLLGSVALAWVLTREMGLDAFSAYLAATPGGLDSVAAVTTELHGDTAVILAVHLVRLLSVLIFGPWLVRGCVRWLENPPADGENV